jgi:hypothetical protein
MRLLYDCAAQLQRGNFRLALSILTGPVLNLAKTLTAQKRLLRWLRFQRRGEVTVNPMKMVKILRLLLVCEFFCGLLGFFTAACLAQSTNDTRSVDEVRLSISLTNNVIPVGSTFSIFAEMRNPSTNVIYINETTPEQDFSIFLTGTSGTVYQISRTPGHITGATVRNLNPGGKDDRIINAWVSRYYEPPGFTPTHKNVPAGDYTLTVATKVATQYKIFKAKSNVVEIQIK